MTQVIKDVVEGTLRRDIDGWSATRVFVVELSPGGNPVTAQHRAMTASGVPSFGDPHPAVPSITVSSINVAHDERLDPLQFAISVDYGGDTAGTVPGSENSGIKGIEVNTSTVTIETLRDWKGNIMSFKYVGPEFLLQFNSLEPPTTSRFVESINAEPAQIDVPTSVVTVTRSRNRPSHVISRDVAGTTNDSKWSGLGTHKWLCMGIDSSTNQSGGYDWRYIFAVAPRIPGIDTWQFRSETIRNSSWVRQDASLGNGIALFNVYKPVNFRSAFGFELPA